METRKLILNDKGKPLTKTQAQKEVREFILSQVEEAWDEKTAEVNIHFDAIIDEVEEVTLRDLLEIIFY